MDNLKKAVIAGLIATGVMSLFMIVAPFIGLPKMDVAALLGALFGGSRIAGWIMHFVIGIVFAYVYIVLADRRLPVENKIARGTIYGILVFIFSEIIFTIINLRVNMSDYLKESMGLMVFGNALACMIYGTVLGILSERTKIKSEGSLL